MDETAQEKLDRLDAANRARVKKFKAKAIAKGFKHITALVDAMTYDELCLRRDRAFQAGEQISIAEVIKRALFNGPIAPEAPAPKAIDNDPRQLLLFVDPIEAPYGNQPGLTPKTKLSTRELDTLILSLDIKGSGAKAMHLNSLGIETRDGKPWTAKKVSDRLFLAKKRAKTHD